MFKPTTSKLIENWSSVNPGQPFKEKIFKLVKNGLITKPSQKRTSTNVTSNSTYKIIKLRKTHYIAEGPSYFGSSGEVKCPNLPTLTEPQLIALTKPQLICMTNDEIGASLFAVEFTNTRSIVGKTPPKIIAKPKKAGIGSSIARKRITTGQHGPIATHHSLKTIRSQKVGTSATKGNRGVGGKKQIKEGKHGIQKESRSLSAVRTNRVSKNVVISH